MITREADYSIRALLFLAQNREGGEVFSVKTMAESIEVPYRFLRKIMPDLTQCGMVESLRGRSGGFRLNKEANEISIYEILRLLSPRSLAINFCLQVGESCPREKRCPVHDTLAKIQDQLDQELKALTLEKLVQRQDQIDEELMLIAK